MFYDGVAADGLESVQNVINWYIVCRAVKEACQIMYKVLCHLFNCINFFPKMDEASNWILSGCNNVWSLKPGHGMYLFNKEG